MEQVYYFNEEDIDEVIFEGYHDEEEERVSKLIEKWKQKDGKNIPKGKTE